MSGEIAVSGTVVARNGIGRFIAECQQAAAATAKELVETGATLSREMAPVGSKPDPRTIPLAQSIETKMVSATKGYWYSTARHALHQEFGIGDFTMIGNPFFSFYWDNAGRMWQAGLYGEPDIINHPGHGEQPFLRPAFKAVTARMMAVARKHYPG